MEITLKLVNRRATRKFGALLATAVELGDLIVLEGDLGAGKTFLVRGFARALGVPSSLPVTSPTFTLITEHKARIPLVHADLYRLSSDDELFELGLVDHIGHDAVVVVEWGDRFADALGNDGLWIWLSLEEDGRTARIAGRGRHGQALFDRLRKALEAEGRAFEIHTVSK